MLEAGAMPDPGHLLPAEAWQAVVAEAERQRARIEAGEPPVEAVEFRQLGMPGPLTSGLLPLNGSVTAPSNGGARPGTSPTFGVLHSAETPLEPGFAAAIARYFAGGTGTSCHYMTDPAETWGVLPDAWVAWHCGNGNTNSLAIEQAGRASFTRAQWLSTPGMAQLRRNAAIMRAARARYGIGCYWMSDAQLLAAHRRQIVGGWATHDQCRRVLGGTSHTDPMPNFPLDVQMQLANDSGDDELMALTAETLAQLRKLVIEAVDDALIEPSPGGVGGTEPRRLASFVGRVTDDAAAARKAAEAAAASAARIEAAVAKLAGPTA